MDKINEKPTPSIVRPRCEMFAIGSCKVTSPEDCAECRDNIWRHHPDYRKSTQQSTARTSHVD